MADPRMYFELRFINDRDEEYAKVAYSSATCQLQVTGSLYPKDLAALQAVIDGIKGWQRPVRRVLRRSSEERKMQ